MADSKTYSGACHCGAVRFEATTDLGMVTACNCSICAAKGLNFAFVPASDFALASGADELVDYRFNTLQITHQFCRVCGVEPFGRGTMPDGSATVAVNVRCLADVDVEALPKTPFDGRSL